MESYMTKAVTLWFDVKGLISRIISLLIDKRNLRQLNVGVLKNDRPNS